VIAILALGLSVVSLGWQTYSWFLVGPVIRVGTMPLNVLEPGKMTKCVQVFVTNTGRMPATLESFSFNRSGGAPISISSALLAPSSDSIRVTVNAHDTVRWNVLADLLVSACDTREDRSE
jgi:hypothetical protein